jgi:hypothetical protein
LQRADGCDQEPNPLLARSGTPSDPKAAKNLHYADTYKDVETLVRHLVLIHHKFWLKDGASVCTSTSVVGLPERSLMGKIERPVCGMRVRHAHAPQCVALRP